MHIIYKCSAIVSCFLGILITMHSVLIEEAFRSFSFIYHKRLDQNMVMNIHSEDSKSLASSVWCTVRLDHSKLCKFKNLYYLPQYKEFLIFFLNGHSIISGITSVEHLKNISYSAVINHTGLNLKLMIIKSKEHILSETIKLYQSNYFIMKRFKPDNIMHVIHDDLLPLFSTYQEMCVSDVQDCVSEYNLIFLDNNEEGPFFQWYNYFSSHKPIFLTKEKSAVCIVNSVVGLSHKSIWYQYGFKRPHGHYSESQLDGLLLSEFKNFVSSLVKINQNEVVIKPTHESLTTVVFLSRKINRKILFESTVENKINLTYHKLNKKNLQILNLDLSSNSSFELIAAIQKSRFLIGMHGSAMVLAMFLPPGSTIIELFPFGIQPFYVSPLKALCSCPNVFYNYLSWVNQNENNTTTHPEYPPLHGGIFHLPMKKQQEIMETKLVPPVECCHNPLYLFRMFQDTIVDDSFYRLVSDVFRYEAHNDNLNQEVYETRMYSSLVRRWYFPPSVLNISCGCDKRRLKIMWNFPFIISSEVTFSLATDRGISLVTNQTTIDLEVVECGKKTKDVESDPALPSVSIWIKTLEDNKESVDSYFQCLIS